MADARAHGFAGWEEYARQRRSELIDALSFVNIPSQRCHELQFADQEASGNLYLITLRLYDLFREVRPNYVVTHPYEGGHPDHDAVCFACHAAQRLLMRNGGCPGVLVEFTSYHMRQGVRVTGEFLPSERRDEVITLNLSADEKLLKQRLFSFFRTQQAVLADFPLDVERFRLAPAYDFSKAPHSGPLYYEMFPWGVTGAQWRLLANQTFSQLELC
jgi:LmbE family N-acetylglucosaminyl deacetylase